MWTGRRPRGPIETSARCRGSRGSSATGRRDSVLGKLEPFGWRRALRLRTAGRTDVCQTQLRSHVVEFI